MGGGLLEQGPEGIIWHLVRFRVIVLPCRGVRGLNIVSNKCDFLAPQTAIGVLKASKTVSNTLRFGGLEHPYCHGFHPLSSLSSPPPSYINPPNSSRDT